MPQKYEFGLGNRTLLSFFSCQTYHHSVFFLKSKQNVYKKDTKGCHSFTKGANTKYYALKLSSMIQSMKPKKFKFLLPLSMILQLEFKVPGVCLFFKIMFGLLSLILAIRLLSIFVMFHKYLWILDICTCTSRRRWSTVALCLHFSTCNWSM